MVVRSAKQNLNELLERRLGNFAAFDVNQLPAPAFAIPALGNEIQGLIHLDKHLLQVVKQSIAANHRWCDRRLVYELNSRSRRVLSHTTNARELSTFYQWEPNAPVKEGNIVTYIEVVEAFIDLSQPSVAKSSKTKTKLNRVSGCDIKIATELMNNLPGVIPMPLYKHQALRLVRELSKVQCLAQIIPLSA